MRRDAGSRYDLSRPSNVEDQWQRVRSDGVDAKGAGAAVEKTDTMVRARLPQQDSTIIKETPRMGTLTY